MFKPSHARALKRLTPIALLAAVIPVLVLLVTSPVKLTLFSQASATSELRVWLEPDILHLAPGESGEVWVMAKFSPENKLLQNLTVLVQTENDKISLNPSEVRMPNPFYGWIRVGTIRVTAPQTRGSYSIAPIISLPADSTRDTQLITATGTIVVN
ncbi:TPA: hypothetical protein DIV55_04080 [Patescibacteria group bacterium]|uniref:Uncharacterized protein n=1 Tax=Candidatus Gottesmanbacteria bacterium GW2011_GWA1_43_11 TaxID=1618436 RepID=A0A0G1CGA6_9BACT|nr:MAG: hypothetical protein UV59_C0017G0030 [Candidatus Gottesmanbacteria bacterium GW2011_GWA1_43_11]HCS78896.1 hypothetical protein [Patescibacteria group bacterium]